MKPWELQQLFENGNSEADSDTDWKKSNINSILEKSREQNITMSLNKSMNFYFYYYALLCMFPCQK